MQNFPLFHQKAYPKWGLYLVGSTISGFGLDTSDVDMCLVSKGSYHLDSRVDARSEAIMTLNDLKTYLLETMSMDERFLLNRRLPQLSTFRLIPALFVDQRKGADTKIP